MNWLIALSIWAVIGFFAAAVYAFVMFRYNSRPMRTADQKQIDRETAAIQRNESAYDYIDALIGLVQRWAKWIGVACAAVVLLIFIASKTI